MIKKEFNFNVLIYEAHLLGKIRKCLKLLDNHGTYFYIKHYKGELVSAHYHIYYKSDVMTDVEHIKMLFLKFVATRVFVQEARMGKNPMIQYMLQNGEYKRSNITSTMSLK